MPYIPTPAENETEDVSDDLDGTEEVPEIAAA
jgi:hypothetical protein